MNNDLVDKMNETLGLVPEVLDGNDIAELKDAQVPAVISDDNPNEHLQSDYETSRETYKSLMEQGQTALTDMMNMAKLCDNPRAFEVVGQLLKITSEVTGELMKLQRDVQTIKNNDDANKPSSANKEVTNNLFVGSTSDLQKMLKEMNQ